MMLQKIFVLCTISVAVSPLHNWRKEGATMSVICFVGSVMAGVISHYICKWLDRHL